MTAGNPSGDGWRSRGGRRRVPARHGRVAAGRGGSRLGSGHGGNEAAEDRTTADVGPGGQPCCSLCCCLRWRPWGASSACCSTISGRSGGCKDMTTAEAGHGGTEARGALAALDAHALRRRRRRTASFSQPPRRSCPPPLLPSVTSRGTAGTRRPERSRRTTSATTRRSPSMPPRPMSKCRRALPRRR